MTAGIAMLTLRISQFMLATDIGQELTAFH
jgi:hypothetical protein